MKESKFKPALSIINKAITVVVVLALAVAGAVLLGQVTVPEVVQYALGYGLLLSAIVYLTKNLK